MTQLITLASLNRPLTCAEFDSNNQALRERANHTGTQLSSTISDFGARVDGLPTIVALQLCCSDLTASIATLRDDIFGSGDLNALLTALEARVVNQINALAAVLGNQQDQITTLTLDISSIIANIQALTTSTSSLQAQITALTAVVVAKAPINSPALTGTPTSTAPLPGDSSTRIATTAFVTASIFPATDTSFGTVRTNTFDAVPIVYRKQEVDTLLTSYAPLNSPTFTGVARINPGAEPPSSANDNKIPTTAWVRSYVSTNVVTNPLASTASPGILKSYSNSGDPVTYLKSDVDDLLVAKASIANPIFTGSATIPNASITGTSTIGNVTLLGSADLTVTPPVTDNSTKIPNTSWVVQYVTGITAPPTGSTGEESQTPILMSRFSGSYSTQRRADINSLIKTLKQAGVYQLLDRLYIMTAPNITDAYVNWVTEYNSSLVSTGTNNQYADIGISENTSLAINGVNTFTNFKANNYSLVVNVWGGSNEILGRISSSAPLPILIGTTNLLSIVRDAITPSNVSCYISNPDNVSFNDPTGSLFSNSSSSSYFGGVSYSNKNKALYLNGTLDSNFVTPTPEAGPTQLIIDINDKSFMTTVVVGAALSRNQHEILTDALTQYISQYLNSGYTTYLG